MIKLSHVLAVFAGLIAAATAFSHRSRVVGEQKKKKKKVIPRLQRTESGLTGEIEKFSHYVGTTFGLDLKWTLLPKLEFFDC